MTKKLWGGRFAGETDAVFAEFNNSFKIDRRLFEADVRASIAYANGLRRAGVFTENEADEIKNGLLKLLGMAATDKNFFESDSEDVHSFIEAKLVGLVGDAGKKLHTGRSRNDQVATAFRLWLRDEISEIALAVNLVQKALIDTAERHKEAVLPGYTHLQKAQPVMWAHWCLAYFEMLNRDMQRLAETRRRTNILPLGSGALAGTAFEIDRDAIAAELGFVGVSANSLDAVSDRDFAVEFAAACSLIMAHLSRLAEDLIIYCTNEFGFIELSDAVTTGSSLMPQKKNPDAPELIRGKAGRVFGHLMSLLTMLKGLPLAYNKDLQEDKEAVFDCADTVKTCLNVAAILLDNISVNEEKTRKAASRGYLNATELADYLVRRGAAFRDAHEAVGKIVLYAMKNNKELEELTLDEFQNLSEKIGEDVFDALSLEQALAAKNQIGGTSPERVYEALEKAKNKIAN